MLRARRIDRCRRDGMTRDGSGYQNLAIIEEKKSVPVCARWHDKRRLGAVKTLLLSKKRNQSPSVRELEQGLSTTQREFLEWLLTRSREVENQEHQNGYNPRHVVFNSKYY